MARPPVARIISAKRIGYARFMSPSHLQHSGLDPDPITVLFSAYGPGRRLSSRPPRIPRGPVDGLPKFAHINSTSRKHARSRTIGATTDDDSVILDKITA